MTRGASAVVRIYHRYPSLFMTHVPAPRQTTGELAMGYPILLAEKIEAEQHEGYPARSPPGYEFHRHWKFLAEHKAAVMGEDWVRLFTMQLHAEWSCLGTTAVALLVRFHAMNWPPLLYAITSDHILQRQNTGR